MVLGYNFTLECEGGGAGQVSLSARKDIHAKLIAKWHAQHSTLEYYDHAHLHPACCTLSISQYTILLSLFSLAILLVQ